MYNQGKERELDMSKYKMVKVSATTFAMVENRRIVFLIKHGKIIRDPLRVRHFQHQVNK
jgi:hypothetical protein